MRKRIGECLIQSGSLTADELQRALREHARTGERIGIVLIRLNLASEKQIAEALALQLGFPYVDLSEARPDPAAVGLVPRDLAAERVCIAIGVDSGLLTVAMSDPLLFSLVEDLQVRTGLEIKPVVAAAGDIMDAIQTKYPDHGAASMTQRIGETGVAERVAASENGLQDVALVDSILSNAIGSRASDVHVEPIEEGVRIRHRLDGVLKDVTRLPQSTHEGLMARLKSMAGLDEAETRLPQEGRLRVNDDKGNPVDFRVSTLGTLFGEKVTLRVLRQRKDVPALEDLGLSVSAHDDLRHALARHQGIILVAGPRGSGRTTTLGSVVRAIKSDKTNIVTIEDPIEYHVPGVNQTQVNRDLDLTFASALRTMVQHDPDVILVGDMRDADTTEAAMQAAQTSLVLTALQADDGPSCVTRLLDWGVEPSTLAYALVCVVSQRLVRQLCVSCRRPYTPTPEMFRALGIHDIDAESHRLYQPVGCDQCSHTGYRGRTGIYEVMPVTDRVRRAIAARALEEQIRAAAMMEGFVSLGEDGLAKVKSGVTTAEELLRVVTRTHDIRMLCSGCGTPVGADFVACPLCGRRLGGGCPHCGRALQPEWQFCPYCARSSETHKRGPERVREKQTRERREPPNNVTEFKK